METYNFKALSFLSKPRNPNYQHLELDPLKNLSRGSLPTEKELVMAGKESKGGQKLQAAMMRVQADMWVEGGAYVELGVLKREECENN
jgi:hypothetical protein